MFYHQKVARVRVFADIQNFAQRAHCVHGIPLVVYPCFVSRVDLPGLASKQPKVAAASKHVRNGQKLQLSCGALDFAEILVLVCSTTSLQAQNTAKLTLKSTLFAHPFKLHLPVLCLTAMECAGHL